MASIIRTPRFGHRARRVNAASALPADLSPAAGGDDAPASAPPAVDAAPPAPARLEADNAELGARNAELEARVAELEAELERLRREGEEKDYSQGYRLGIEAGSAEARAGLQQERDAVHALLASVGEQGEQYLRQLEETNVEIVFSAVAKMIAGIAENPAYLHDLVRAQSRRVAAANGMLVRLAPQDYQALFDDSDGGDADADTAQGRPRFVADDRVQHGGCIIEADGGGLDARLEIQLQRFKEMLLDVYRRRQSAERQP